MRITESRLRRIIRSVISEQMDHKYKYEVLLTEPDESIEPDKLYLKIKGHGKDGITGQDIKQIKYPLGGDLFKYSEIIFSFPKEGKHYKDGIDLKDRVHIYLNEL
tara:strand:+ start:945 stop:1259 length:315 start_codon:yes stop_codon:yes gene_type:complete